jgi:hypothetical protein
MTTDFYVVRHHGAWRIRVNGKHYGEYSSRVVAINAAVTEAQAAESGATVFSTGIVSQFSQEWQSKDGPNSHSLCPALHDPTGNGMSQVFVGGPERSSV